MQISQFEPVAVGLETYSETGVNLGEAQLSSHFGINSYILSPALEGSWVV